MKLLIFLVLLPFTISDIDDKYGFIVAELKKNGFSETEITYFLNDPRLEDYPDIIERFRPTNNPSLTYEALFLNDVSIKEGKEFLNDNLSQLQRVQDAFGIPKEIFVAILRVESHFGNNIGEYQAAGSLLSAVKYGNRGSNIVRRAEREFVSLMILSRDAGIDPFRLKSSYAGAFGIFQFLPSSYIHYAIDGNGDGVVDPFNIDDALWSIANYLIENGWRRNNYNSLFSYNRSHAYVRCILTYAEEIKK